MVINSIDGIIKSREFELTRTAAACLFLELTYWFSGLEYDRNS